MPDQLNKQELSMLREEMELLMRERNSLLKVAGAAAVLVANTDGRDLPEEAAEAAELLSTLVNELPEETLQEALESVSAQADPDDLGW
jgi:tellurite resistance protein